jgi:predicted RND superfamily exporter protein
MPEDGRPISGERRRRLVELAMARPRLVMWLVGALTVVLALGSLNIEVDTDPENMLPGDEPVRVRNAEMREAFGTGELLVVGIVADDEPGILTDDRLGAVGELHRRIAGFDGVHGSGVVSYVTAADSGTAASDPGVAAAVDAVQTNPLLAGNVLSEDGTTAAVFVPLQDKSDANPVAADIETAIGDLSALASLDSYVAGLPLAEEAFGQEMFIQMAIFAPLAGLLIFLLMLWFFRKLSLVAAAMAVAMLTVIWTMGLLMGTGNTLHIMSSMIPIFLMPIAILDSVHVLSEFYDRYPHHLDRRTTLRAVYGELYRPLTYTSLTTAVAFASLAIAPIPPVRVFGIFVATGVSLAWVLTVVFLPALVMLTSEQRLARSLEQRPESHDPFLVGGLRAVGRFAIKRRLAIPLVVVALAAVAIPGITRITVNDNPVNWFKPASSVRQATDALNDRLPGTFNANLLVTADEPGALLEPEALAAIDGLQELWDGIDVVGSSTSYAELTGGAAPADELAGAFDQHPELVSTLVSEDTRLANLRLQLNDGDNQAMRQVVDATDEHLAANPLPAGVDAEWAGETYLNLVWQDKMVNGMLEAFATTLLVVMVLMVALFRSLRWAILSILPVLWSVLAVYGAIGFAGKDYDMPIAVLSTLVLGIGIDFAIHFVQRYRELCDQHRDPTSALSAFFEEPARALTRNALVIAIGFTPLFFADLVPYLVVGAFLSAIIVLSWLATLLLLPALASWRQPALAPQHDEPTDAAHAADLTS